MAKVLVVDDDITLREAYSMVIGGEHEVQSAADGEAALKIAQADPPDVIVLDMIMPRMSGLDFVEQFKPDKHPKTKIIIFSNSNAEEDSKKALKLGATKYVLKSHYTPVEALALVNDALKA